MSFNTVSAILRGQWLLDNNWAQQHISLVAQMLNGKSVDFGGEPKKDFEGRSPLSATSPAYLIYPQRPINAVPEGSVAMINIQGPVLKYGDVCAYGAVDHSRNINRIVSSGKFSGIILNVDGPGGEVHGTAMLADAVKAASKKMPVIGVVDDGMAASADMWIISAASEIYTTKETDQIGSIGIYTTIADWYGYLKKEGFNVRDIYAPQSTEKNKDYRDALEGKDEAISSHLETLANQFIATIRNNRSGKLKNDSWTKGKLFFATEAKEVGLIDDIIPMHQVFERMDQLIAEKKQFTTSNNNTMAFERTLGLAQAENFEVAEGGFLLTEDQLNSIESAIVAQEKDTEENQSTVNSLTSEASEREEQIKSLEQERDSLQQEVEQLKEDAPDFSSTSRDKDEDPKAKNEYETSFDKEVQNLKNFII